MPLNYGSLVTAHAFAGGDTLVKSVVKETFFAAYAVYIVMSESKASLEHLANLDKTNYNFNCMRMYMALALQAA